MKNKTILKQTILISSIILVCIAIPIILYFAISQTETNNSQTIDLTSQYVIHSAKVQHMNKINEEEANVLKSDIEQTITNKMSDLTIEKNIDYEIKGLNEIQKDIHLNTVQIKISSLETSKKAKGESTLHLTVQENINNRKNEPINIPTREENNLSSLTATLIRSAILTRSNTILNQGQVNHIDVDYEILNLSLIAEGAKFSDYNDKIIVKAKPETNRLEGSFLIIFQLQ